MADEQEGRAAGARALGLLFLCLPLSTHFMCPSVACVCVCAHSGAAQAAVLMWCGECATT
jgi:hypothetical protein